MTKTRTVSLRMDEGMIAYLKKMSHYVSIERNKDLTYNDLIVEAVQANFPMPLESQSDNEKQDNGSQCL